VATLVQRWVSPTGCPALGLGLTRYKFMAASLLQGAGIPIPANTRLLERIGDVDRYSWQFPVIVQPSQEHAGIGLDRESVVSSKTALRHKVRTIITTYRQPALVQRFCWGGSSTRIVGARGPACRRWPRWTFALPAASCHHVLRGQVPGRDHRIPEIR
jgi:hypothetical protein